jgi:hypothetical protein
MLGTSGLSLLKPCNASLTANERRAHTTTTSIHPVREGGEEGGPSYPRRQKERIFFLFLRQRHTNKPAA